jgi:hypothetical protein
VEELFALEAAPPVLPSLPDGGMGLVEAASPVGLTPVFTLPVPVALFWVPDTGGGTMAPLGWVAELPGDLVEPVAGAPLVDVPVEEDPPPAPPPPVPPPLELPPDDP